MFASAPSLISRLRRRLAGAAWLFAVLILMKGAIATACATDGLADHAGPPAAVEITIEKSMLADADGPCWHAGAGGCHCSCVHVTPLLSESPSFRAVTSGRTHFPPGFAVAHVAPRDDDLRPPIA